MPAGTGCSFDDGVAVSIFRKLVAGTMAILGVSGVAKAAAQNSPVWADTNSSVTYGTEATDPDAADKAAIAQLKAQGSDITKPTDVFFYLYFPSKVTAEALRAEFSDRGFSVDIHQPAGYEVWVLAANKTMVPDETTIISLSHDFTALAETQGGHYDGWEAALVD